MIFKFSSLFDRSISLNLLLWLSVFYSINNGDRLQAQVIEDGTLSTEVTTDNNSDFTVNAGEQRGNNLFHSFAEFSIPNNGSVFFDNGLSIQNIITRVTGSSISNIDGLIQSNGTANLFLINPNGIIFGENARLNIGGSFVGTTAESLVFEDNTEFSTNLNNSDPLLTVSVPLGLQFNGNPGDITNRANFSLPNPFDPTGQSQLKLGLTTPPEKTLALLGGDITFDGGAVTAAGGNVELGSVGEDSFVVLESIAGGWRVNYDNVSQFKNIKLDNLASVDASGEGGGGINIQSQSIQVLNGSVISSNTIGETDGQDIKITALNAVEIKGSDRTNQNLDPTLSPLEIFLPISSRIVTNTFGQGNGSNIQIDAAKLSILDGAKIQAQTTAIDNSSQELIGKGGNISINANISVELRGSKSLLGLGDNVSNILSFLFPSIPPEARDVVSSDRIISLSRGSSIDVASFSNGSSGDLDIVTRQLILKEGSSISNSPSPFGSGDGGDIRIEAFDSVQILGSTKPESQSVGIITANTLSSGNAGDIRLNTDKLELQGGGGITAGTLSLGDGGEININANSIEINGTSGDGVLSSGIGSEAFSVGNAGDVIVNTESLTITDKGQITVRGLSFGTPGNLLINANSVRLSNNAQITAENAGAFDGGNIELNIIESLTLEKNSLISAQAFGDANGGNINISDGFLIANPNENNDILATAIRGDGGNINISGDGIFGIKEGSSKPRNFSNDIDASSEFGLDGMVSFNFPETANSDSEQKKPSNILNVSNLLDNNFCKISQGSKYYFIGKGGIAFSPDRDLNIQNNWVDFRFFEDKVAELEEKQEPEKTPSVAKIEPIQGWFKDSNGQIVLTAKSLGVTPNSLELPHPSCNNL